VDEVARRWWLDRPSSLSYQGEMTDFPIFQFPVLATVSILDVFRRTIF